MTNECPTCGAYMINPCVSDRCDRCEIARLRAEIRRYIQADNKLSSDMIGGHDEYNRWRKQWNAALKELREISREEK